MDQTTFDMSDDDKDPRILSQQKAEEALLEQLRREVQERRQTPLRDADADAAFRAAMEDMGKQSAVDTHPSKGKGQKTAAPEPRDNVRGHVLETANKLVNGDRNNQYGDPRQDFQRTADYFSIYIKSIIEREGGAVIVRPHDIGIMQILLKISRLAWTPAKADHYYDVAGYAACAADCADAEYGGLT